MPRTKASLLNNLSTADLKRLLAARVRIDTLEAEQSKLLKALSSIEKELAKLMADAVTGAPVRKAGRKKARRKATAKVGKKTGRRKTASKKITAKAASAKKASAKKGGARKVSTRKSSASTKVKLEDVVAGVISKNKGPVAFKDLFAAIVKGKLFKSKSSNFDNVLRRTLSTSTKVKRVGRGLYDVA